jgi:hypothetical protein
VEGTSESKASGMRSETNLKFEIAALQVFLVNFAFWRQTTSSPSSLLNPRARWSRSVKVRLLCLLCSWTRRANRKRAETSKRTTTHMRAKVSRKAAESNRKAKKAAKKDVTWKSSTPILVMLLSRTERRLPLCAA